jgi:PAS domain S-box-containing protein
MLHSRLQDPPAFFADLAEHVEDAVVATDAALVVTGWSAGAERTYGWSADEVLGRHACEVLRPEMDEAERMEARTRTAEEGRSRVDVVSRRKDGTAIHVEIASVALRGPDGEIDGYLGIHRDVTEHRRAATALLEAQARVEEVLERVTDAFYALDPQWRFTYLNERAVRHASRLAGRQLTREGLLGLTLWETLPAIVGTSIEERYRRALREQRTAVFEYAYPGDGSAFLVHAYPSERGLSIYFRDITAHKSAEAERATRARQQAIVAALGLRALGTDDLQSVADEAVAVVAHTLAVPTVAITQLQRDDRLLLRAGFGWEEGAVGTATTYAGRRSLVGYTILAGQPVVSDDVTSDARFEISPLLSRLGPVSAASVVITGRDGPFGALGAFAEDRRWFSESDVSFLQAVANVLAAAVERSEAAEKLIEVRDSERRRIAHDLHDHALQDLSLALAEASRAAASGGEADVRSRLATAVPALRRVGEQLRRAIYDLRLGVDQDRPFPEMLAALVQVHRGMAAGGGIDLELDDALPSRPLGNAATEVVRILGEALTDARRHAGAGRVRVRAWGPPGRLCAEVSDDGRGSDPAAGAFTDDRTRLAEMRERAALIGAQLDIVSRLDGGTTVRVQLELGEHGPDAEGQVRVLLVEDHASVREAIATAFEHAAGFEIAGQASTLAEAREQLEDVDVAVIDLGLPDGYGADLIAELRRVSPRAQALVLSATLDRVEIARAVESGAAAVLHKTVSFDDVVHAVRRLRAGETLIPVAEASDLLRFAGHQRRREEADRRSLAQLTPRELEVLQLLAEGRDSQQIADVLFISLRTERNHVASILSKLGVHSQLQALVLGLRYGLVTVPRRG